MQDTLDRFLVGLDRARALGLLYANLSNTTAPVLDLTDLLRSQVVLAVSAFDHFIHELAREGAVEAFDAKRPRTDAFLRFDVSVQTLNSLLDNPTNSAPFDQEIRYRHSWLSFQKPDKIADALRIATDKKIWPEVGKRLKMPTADVKTRIATIADRRNQIAHEGDLDPSDPARQARWPISPTDAGDATDFLERVGRSIFKVVR